MEKPVEIKTILQVVQQCLRCHARPAKNQRPAHEQRIGMHRTVSESNHAAAYRHNPELATFTPSHASPALVRRVGKAHFPEDVIVTVDVDAYQLL